MSPEDVDAQQTKTNDSFLLSVLNCISRSSCGHVQPQQPPWMTACAVWSLRGKARGITTLNLSARTVTVTLRSISASCCGACPPFHSVCFVYIQTSATLWERQQTAHQECRFLPILCILILRSVLCFIMWRTTCSWSRRPLLLCPVMFFSSASTLEAVSFNEIRLH